MKLHSLLVTAALAASTAFANPAEFWLDLVAGEEARHAEVFADLAEADVIYVGESHTIDRHHAVQLGVLQELHARGRALTLCMEQLEARDQPAIDRFNSGALTFDQLATELGWAKKWKNFARHPLNANVSVIGIFKTARIVAPASAGPFRQRALRRIKPGFRDCRSCRSGFTPRSIRAGDMHKAIGAAHGAGPRPETDRRRRAIKRKF